MFAIHFPTDLSAPSRHALAVAATLARDHDARLILLHVAEPLLVSGEFGYTLSMAEGEAKAVGRRLREFHVPEVPTEYHLKRGAVADEILHLADEAACDLIVMGTHGRRGVGRLLMGRMAEAVLRRARCPVLTVRGPVPGPASATRQAESVATRA